MKVDLHLHSRHSRQAAEWLFRRAGLAPSYSEPAALYETLRGQGMQGFTLTDYHSIDGCLEVADRPGVFLSEQVRALFPEDRCPVQILVWGLTEEQHRELQQARQNIYELQSYLARQNLAHAVAHPLYGQNDHYTRWHVERLLLLFRHFEGVNGLRDQLVSDAAKFLLTNLSAERMERLANEHNLAPTHPEPWRKVLTGGSDDQGGLFPGRAWTEVEGVSEPAAFLEGVRSGCCTPGGSAGRPLALAHSFYNNLRHLLADRSPAFGGSLLVSKAFSRFVKGEDPTDFSWKDKLGLAMRGLVNGELVRLARLGPASLGQQLLAIFQKKEAKERLAKDLAVIEEPERRAFVLADYYVNQLALSVFGSSARQLARGNFIEAIREGSVLLPLAGTLLPYLYGFRSQAPARARLRELCRELTGALPGELQNRKRAWFTDTLDDVNGVATTIRKLTAACVQEGYDLTVITCRAGAHAEQIPLKNFTPIGEFAMPEYEAQKLAFPPILQMLEYIQREGFTEVIISVPGPVGLVALLAAKVLGLRSSGIYHTDFPQYVRILSEGSALETLTWNYMRWFYGQLDLMYVNSEGYRQDWQRRGIPAERLAILPRGLDTTLFHPGKRDPAFWTSRGAPAESRVLLYVGRISREKDLDLLVPAWAHLHHSGLALALVGDGPYLRELRELLPEAIFTGALSGEDLAQAFASADVFLFPSTTDTFGNVIVEAMASGLPCVVSDVGGPKDLVEEGSTGLITRARDVNALVEAVREVLRDSARQDEMRRRARASVERRDWREAARSFWARSSEAP